MTSMERRDIEDEMLFQFSGIGHVCSPSAMKAVNPAVFEFQAPDGRRDHDSGCKACKCFLYIDIEPAFHEEYAGSSGRRS